MKFKDIQKMKDRSRDKDRRDYLAGKKSGEELMMEGAVIHPENNSDMKMIFA